MKDVLIIGDSISIGYTPIVQKLLTDSARVARINENGGPTSNGVEKIDLWLGATAWHVVHFNFGLHDIKLMPPDGKHQVPLDRYQANLRHIVARLKRTPAKLIFATTTPAPLGKLSPPRNPPDVLDYNVAARAIMAEEGVALNDLFSLALPQLTEIQQKENVHFTAAGYQKLGEQVAAAIRRHL
ncbi:MAG: SGNH/GDSL hydrolase family protein [Bryobacteraceae bacterium]|nr:SGNH/GDSL hydrolase family protein [Bryobacteraceae bacterium]